MQMKGQIHSIIVEVFHDVQEAVHGGGDLLTAEVLADTVCDRMHDSSEEYRNMPYEQRRAMVLEICSQYT